jgi:putative hemolysin
MRAVEDLSGRRGLLPVYYRWRRDVAGKSPRMMGELLEMVDARIELNAPAWPPVLPADTPLVIVANHPFGIGDGIALLALAEQLGRPYRILITAISCACRKSVPSRCRSTSRARRRRSRPT